MLAAATLAGVAAAWLVNDYARSLERRDGAPVTVLVATAQLRRGELLDPRVLGTSVAARKVPRSFATPGAIASLEQLAGLRPLADLPPGTQLSAVLFAGAKTAPGLRLRRGERAISIAATVVPDGAEIAPGQTVDVFAGGIGGGTSVGAVVIGAEVLATGDAHDSGVQPSEEAPESEVAKRGAGNRLTLRVTAVQAASLIRADAFAADLRAVLRP